MRAASVFIALIALSLGLLREVQNDWWRGWLIVSCVLVANAAVWLLTRDRRAVWLSAAVTGIHYLIAFDCIPMADGRLYIPNEDQVVNQTVMSVLTRWLSPPPALDLRDFMDYETWRNYRRRTRHILQEFHAILAILIPWLVVGLSRSAALRQSHPDSHT